MSIDRFFVHDLVILRPAELEDRYEDTAADWDHATSTTVRGWLAQTSSDEDNDHRDATITRAVAFLPAATDVAAGDRIRYDGTVWDVVGVPNVGHTPRGPHHIEAALRSAEG